MVRCTLALALVLVLVLALALVPLTEVNTTEGCADGQVYNSCGSKCLLTCDNYQEPPVACEQVCVEGCFCADGLLEHNGSCVSPQECPQGGLVGTVDFTSDGTPVGVAAGNLWLVRLATFILQPMEHTNHKFPAATATGVPSEVKSTVHTTVPLPSTTA